MDTIAIAIICKTPRPGHSKTRLSPPLHPEDCAAISACFIQDLAGTIGSLSDEGGSTGYAVYTPVGSEAALRPLLPDNFGLVPQCEGGFGERLYNSVIDLLALGHAGAIVVNSDSPTLPASVLRAAVAALRRGDNVVLSPAHDGGYTLIGLTRPHAHLFADIPWSTPEVYRLTLERARAINLPVVTVGGWYDIDDADSYAMLEDELDGIRPPFADAVTPLTEAPATRRFVAQRRRISKVA
jgi:hypothetical protein